MRQWPPVLNDYFCINHAVLSTNGHILRDPAPDIARGAEDDLLIEIALQYNQTAL
jgi:hypothetical protein